MKSLLVFAEQILKELGIWCQVSTDLDLKTVKARYEYEGQSFLTISLARFGKSFEKSLDLGHVDRNHFDPMWGFSGGVPTFMSGFLGQVFSRKNGVLLEDPSIVAIRSIRQFSLMFAKIDVLCSDERVQKAKDRYFQCESEVREHDGNLDPAEMQDFERVGRLIWTDMFAAIDYRVYYRDYLPKHGSGSTANRILGNQKYALQEWTTRLEAQFPFIETACASYSQYTDLDHVNFREPKDEIPVRVICVPKDSKGPRIIAMEPSYMQYVQQALHEVIVEEIRRFHIPRSLICYDYQLPNQEMARIGSLNGSLATLDLSEASDRVSYQHVRALLARFPNFLDAVDACRSRKADVDGKTIRLAKFASMGSALCFPFEAMVFTTLVFLGIEKCLGRKLNRSDIESHLDKVRVYGDDIIVPVDYALSVKSTLETFGLKVNTDKSFWTGKFRESCGKDYYAGYDVSVTRIRQMFPNNRRDVKQLVTTVSLRNRLAKAGFAASVEWLDTLISGIIPFPEVGENSPILGRVNPSGLYEVHRIHPDFQYPEVKGYMKSDRIPINSIDGYAALLKWYLKRGDSPFADTRHLHRSGRPSTVDIKLGWARSH